MIWRMLGSGRDVGVVSGDDSGDEATLLIPPTVEPEKCTRRGGRTSAVVGAVVPLTVEAGESEAGAGELVGVLTDVTDACDETGVAVVLPEDGGGTPGGVVRPGVA